MIGKAQAMARNAFRYPNRAAAGRALAKRLRKYAKRKDVIVLALPRGGVPVALEIVRDLRVDFDLLLVRKLGAPDQEELAMGAMAWPENVVLNAAVVEAHGISPEAIEEAIAREKGELTRRNLAYRGGRAAPGLGARTVIVVDDGMATDATMHAALDVVSRERPARIVVAVPVAPPDAAEALNVQADEVVCPLRPEPFFAVGGFYDQFEQLDDETVLALTREAAALAENR